LPSSITPGATATFTFTIKAPATAGTYNFQWRMVQDGVAWFGATTPNVAIKVTAPPTPVNGATFVTQTVPTGLQAGQTATVSVQMKNTGTTTWTAASNYKLGSQNPTDNTTWGLSRVALPGSIAPGATATFSFPITAPATAGTYNFQWKMVQVGVAWFGAASTNVAIVVTAPSSSTPPSATTPSTRTTTITYYDNTAKWVLGQVASRTLNGVVAESHTYSAATGLPLTHSTFGRLRQTLTYNADGTVATVKDGNSKTTTLSSWKRGIPQTITFADGTTRSAVVNDNGWITRVTDENGYATNYTYDAMGRLASTVYPTGDTTAWNSTVQAFVQVNAAEYGIPAGHWRQTVSTGNGVKVSYFDALWRPLLVREYDSANAAATQRFTGYEYDHEGRVVYASYPSAASNPDQGVWTTYDALGRVTSVAQDSELGLLTTTTSYLSNADGAYTQVTDPEGQITRTWYQMFDQPAYDAPVRITQPEGVVTAISRDVFGKPLSITRGNSSGSMQLTRSYSYNANQELCRSVEPETGATLMGYDGAGNLIWSAAGLPATTACEASGTSAIVAARRVARSYDARSRITFMAMPDGKGNQSWTYTPDGLVDSSTVDNDGPSAGSVDQRYTYNKRRLLVSESSSPRGWHTWNLGYGYTANGQLASQSYPDGLTVTYAPNALGQPTKVADMGGNTYANGISYFPNGAIKQFTYGNGLTHTLTQNARGLPARSCDAYGNCSAAAVLDDSYSYSANGNVSKITDGRSGARSTRTLTYDGLGRLKTAVSPMFGNAAYAYDVLDNLTRVTVGATANLAARDHYYCYDARWQLTNIKTGSCTGASVVGLSYDAQGNLANKNGTTYGFDFGNRLRTVQYAGGLVEGYLYDTLGRRVLASNGTGSLWSMYANGGALLYQSNERTGKSTDYVMLNGHMVASVEHPNAGGAATITYQHTDALGSPVAVTNASGVVTETSEYEPFGRVGNRAARDGVGYTGHAEDAATGLSYMQQRYYDPAIGRFLSRDPVTANANTGANFNAYWYANNNPYRFKDPDGRSCTETDGVRSCVVDSYVDRRGKEIPRAEMTKSQLSNVRGFEKSYTSAVNKLMANPGKSVTISMPGKPGVDGKPGELGKQASTTAGEVGKALIGRNIVANSPLAGGGMATGGNTTYIGSLGLSGGGSIVGITTTSSDMRRELEITHEGMHGDGTGVSPALRGDMPIGPWNDAHQIPLNEASRELLEP